MVECLLSVGPQPNNNRNTNQVSSTDSISILKRNDAVVVFFTPKVLPKIANAFPCLRVLLSSRVYLVAYNGNQSTSKEDGATVREAAMLGICGQVSY